jgi:hypothetical protein
LPRENRFRWTSLSVEKSLSETNILIIPPHESAEEEEEEERKKLNPFIKLSSKENSNITKKDNSADKEFIYFSVLGYSPPSSGFNSL